MKKTLFFAALLLFGLLTGAEIIVGPQAPYKTIRSGLAALKPGDTMIIEPGRYYESITWINPLKNNLIRARFPGSVLLHGDKAAPARFTKVPGYRFVYCAPWNDNVMAVNEHDSLKIYLPAVNVRDLEFKFGYWVKKDGKLYISTSDGEAPEKHRLTVSVLRGQGLKLENPTNVTIDGLVVTGFYSRFQIDDWSGIAGIKLANHNHCTIRNCRAFFNGNGIVITRGCYTTIENCIAYANGSHNPQSGGNIIGFGGSKKMDAHHNTMRNCISMFRQPTGGAQDNGIRFYFEMSDCLIDRCSSIGEYGMNIKGSNPKHNNRLTNSYSQYHQAAYNGENNVFGVNGSKRDGYNPKQISPLMYIKPADYEKHYADPANHDFRPIAEVTIGLPKTMKSGSSIILPPGKYPRLVVKADNVWIKTRGNGVQAQIAGALITGKNVKIDNLEFTAPVVLKGENNAAFSCNFKSSFNASGNGYALTHCRFAKTPVLKAKAGFHHSCIGAPRDVLEDGKSLDAFPLGPFRMYRAALPVKVVGPFVRNVTDTAVDIEWWSADSKVAGTLVFGTEPKCQGRAGQPFSGGNWHSVSLTNLKPGTQYYFKVQCTSPLREHHSNPELAAADLKKKRTTITSIVQSFKTMTLRPAPRTFVVKAGHSIGDALDKTRPGDTVLVKGGTYPETLYVRSCKTTIKNASGEKVTLDGKSLLAAAVMLENKPETVLDGFFIRRITDGTHGAIVINGGQDITVSRCFYDGRDFGYTPGIINANAVKNLTVANCFATRGFAGSHFWRCPGLLVRNCVFFNNQIPHTYIHNMPDEPVTIRNCVIGPNIPVKIGVPLIGLLHIESLTESDNCYCTRIPEQYRKMFSYAYLKKKLVRGQDTYPEFLKTTGTKRTSIFANPGFKAVPQPMCYKNPQTATTAEGKEEQTMLSNLMNKNEFKLIPRKGNVPAHFQEWDFSDWMATNPEVLSRNMGFEPRLFTKGIPR